MNSIVLISGVAGMTGSLVAQRLLERNIEVVGFDNYFAGSRQEVEKLQGFRNFHFFEYDLVDSIEMDEIFAFCTSLKQKDSDKLVLINCAAIVHTKHFYQPYDTFLVNVVGMKDSLDKAISAGFDTYLNCSTSEVYSLSLIHI